MAFTGALAAGILTVLIVEFIHRQSRVKPDAAICIAFTTLFAIGVVLMSMLESTGLSYRRRLRVVRRNRFRAAGTSSGLERIRTWSALGICAWPLCSRR